jgi:hypothetical protein
MPRDASSVLVVDPKKKTVTFAGNLAAVTAPKWNGAVLAPNGTIYGIPAESGNVLIVETGSSGFCGQVAQSGYLNKM